MDSAEDGKRTYRSCRGAPSGFWPCGIRRAACALLRGRPEAGPGRHRHRRQVHRGGSRAAHPLWSLRRRTRPIPTSPRSRRNSRSFRRNPPRNRWPYRLADSVGHLRVGTNFAWTLNTGYLVLFMQAGFALLTCGLVRKKNAAHLMMLNFAAYVFAFLAYYAVGYAFQFGAVAVNAAPSQHRRNADAQSVSGRRRAVGLPGRQRLLPDRPGL